MMARMRVTIVGGTGGVGASAAFNLLRAGEGHDVVLVDRRPAMVTSHVMDLEQTLGQGAAGTIRGGDASDVVGSDVLVVTAAVPLTVNTSRLVYLDDNAAILADVIDTLPADWPGVVIVVTNPVDPLVTWAQRRTGLDRLRVVGYTLNDSLRLRTGLANRLGVTTAAVDAWVVGEHGDACVPLWDRVRVAGQPVDVAPDDRAAAEEFLRTWYVKHVALDSGRSSTWTSGLGIARMISAMARDDGELWPSSIVLQGEYGVEGLALSVPVRLGPAGVREIVEWDLDPGERSALDRAAGLVNEMTESIAVEPAR